MAHKYANSYYKVSTRQLLEDGAPMTGYFTRSKFIPLDKIKAEARAELMKPGMQEVHLYEVYDDCRNFSFKEINFWRPPHRR